MDNHMTFSWGRSVISYVTAVSLTAALVVGVFSQSHNVLAHTALAHSTLGNDIQAEAMEPCAEHMAVSSPSVDHCLSLCDAADLEHFVGVLSERQDPLEHPAALVTYWAPMTLHHDSRHANASAPVRGPPDKDIYLLTQRLRL